MATSGIVKSVSGTVTAIATDGTERILQVGDMVLPDEQIVTGAAGMISVDFEDGTHMDMGRDSRLTLNDEGLGLDPEEDIATTDVLDEVAAMQAALESGGDFDPNNMEATAAGAGTTGNEGSTTVNVAFTSAETTPDSGFDTVGVARAVFSTSIQPATEGTAPTTDEIIGSDGGADDDSNSARFTDNFVSGVSYTTSSGLSGLTGDSGVPGEFKYNVGDDIVFKIGDVIIAEFNASVIKGDLLFLQDIAGTDLSDSNLNYVENMAIFLQSLDSDLQDSTPDDGILQTNSLVDIDASYETNINITQEVRDSFIGYIDNLTGEALNIATAGKEMISEALATQGIEFTRESELNENGENVFETIAMAHVADTIQELAGDRTPDAADTRLVDLIDVPGGLITYNFQTDVEGSSTISFTTDDLLLGATGLQVVTDNLVVKNVVLDANYADIGTLVNDGDGKYHIDLNEGITSYDLEGLTIDYRVEDWTAFREISSTTLDTYKSHLSAVVENVVEDAGYNQFTIKSTLDFDTDQQLTVKFSPEGSGSNFAEYSDDFFSAPIEYSNDGGISWQSMEITGSYMRDDYDKPLPTYTFVLEAGSKEVDVRISIFDDPFDEQPEGTIAEIAEATAANGQGIEFIDMLIEGENFYTENLQPGIIDNDPSTDLPIVEVDFAIVSESDGVATLTFSLVDANKNPIINETGEDITVDFNTVDGNALAGQDYTVISGTAIISADQSTVTVDIPIIDDAIFENTEFLTLQLSNVSENAVLGDPEASVRIYDNDGVVVTGETDFEGENVIFTVTPSSVIPAGAVFELHPTNSKATATKDVDYDSSTLRAYYIDAQGQEHTLVEGKDTGFDLPDGVKEFFVSYQSTVDNVLEANETVRMQVSTTFVNTSGEAVENFAFGTATIVDVTEATIVIGDAGSVEEADGAYLTYSVGLSNAVGEDVNISLNTDGIATSGTDYDATLEYQLADGTWASATNGITLPADASTVSVRVAVTDDAITEGSETVILGATTTNSQITDATDTGLGTITDDRGSDNPDVDADITANISVANAANVAEDNASYSKFTISLDAAAAEDVVATLSLGVDSDAATDNAGSADYVVKYYTLDANGTSYTEITSGEVTLPAEGTGVDVYVNITDDLLTENNETFTLTATNKADATDTDTGTAVITDDRGSDNPDVDADITATIVIGDAGSVEEADGAYLTYSVGLSNAVGEDVNISLNTDGTATSGADYDATLEYQLADGTWASATNGITLPADASTVNVRIAVTDDVIAEGSETVILSATTTNSQITSETDTGLGTIIDSYINAKGGDSIQLSVDEADITAVDTNSTLTFTAGTAELTTFKFDTDLSSLITNTDGLVGDEVVWNRVSDTVIQGTVDGNLAITLELVASNISAGVTDDVKVKATLSDNLKHDSVAGQNILNLGDVKVIANTSAGNDEVLGSVSLDVKDNIIEITQLSNTLLSNTEDTIGRGRLIIDEGEDELGSLVFNGVVPEGLRTAGGESISYQTQADGSLKAIDASGDDVFILSSDGVGYALQLDQVLQSPVINTTISLTGGVVAAGSPTESVTQVTQNGVVINISATDSAGVDDINAATDGYGVDNNLVNEGDGEVAIIALDDPSAVFGNMSVTVGNFSTTGSGVDVFTYQLYKGGNEVGSAVSVGATAGNDDINTTIQINGSDFDEIRLSASHTGGNTQTEGAYKIIAINSDVTATSSDDVILDFGVDVTDTDGDVHGGDFQVSIDTNGDGVHSTMDAINLDLLIVDSEIV